MSTARLNDRLARQQPLVLGLFRIVLGLLFHQRGRRHGLRATEPAGRHHG